MILGWFWNFLIIAVSWSFSKSVLFEGHSKVFNVSTVSAKCLLKVLAISSFFTSKVSFLITLIELLIFPFFSKNYLRINMSMLVGKVGLTLIPKRFWIFWYLYFTKITKFWISILFAHPVDICRQALRSMYISNEWRSWLKFDCV